MESIPPLESPPASIDVHGLPIKKDAVRRRFRFQFSLRTLLAGIFFAVCGFTLWWRWEPWEWKGEAPGFRSGAVFSEDGQRWAASEHWGFTPWEAGRGLSRINLHEKNPSASPFDIPSECPVAFSPDNRFLLLGQFPRHRMTL